MLKENFYYKATITVPGNKEVQLRLVEADKKIDIENLDNKVYNAVNSVLKKIFFKLESGEEMSTTVHFEKIKSNDMSTIGELINNNAKIVLESKNGYFENKI